MEQFDSMLSTVIDSTLGHRCSSVTGYQYSEIVRSLMNVYFCGGSCVEDVKGNSVRNSACRNADISLCACEADARSCRTGSG